MLRRESVARGDMHPELNSSEKNWARTPLKIGMAVVGGLAVLVPVVFGLPALALAGTALLLSLAAALDAVDDPVRFARAVHVACALGLFAAGHAVFADGWSAVMVVYACAFVLLAQAQVLGAPGALAWSMPCMLLVTLASFWEPTARREVPDGLAFLVRSAFLLTTLGFALSFRHARDRQERALERLARTDALTGLCNRRELMRVLEQAHGRSMRSGRAYGIIYIDLDGLKLLNDEAGHLTGDALLLACAERIRRAIRMVDIPARLGGDEFVVLLTEVDDTAGSVALARRLLETLEEPFVHQGETIPVAASMGIAVRVAESEGGAGEELLHRADEAMYAAKAAGGSRIHVHGPDGPVPVDARGQVPESATEV